MLEISLEAPLVIPTEISPRMPSDITPGITSYNLSGAFQEFLKRLPLKFFMVKI